MESAIVTGLSVLDWLTIETQFTEVITACDWWCYKHPSHSCFDDTSGAYGTMGTVGWRQWSPATQ